MTIQLTSSATDNTAIIKQALTKVSSGELITIPAGWWEFLEPIDMTPYAKETS